MEGVGEMLNMIVNGRMRGLMSSSLLLMFIVSLPPPPSHALPLDRGATVLTPGTTLTDRPELEGDIIESSAVPFTGRNVLQEVLFTGTLVEAVVV